MTLEYRSPSEDELRAALAVGEAAFASELRDDVFDRARQDLDLERVLAAYDDGRPVGVAAAYSFELTIPRSTIPAAGVTWVGVLPSHRRRGILTEFMRRQLDDAHGRREPVAILWASEAPIYGRFGYGMAAPTFAIDADADRVDFLGDPDRRAAVRLVDGAEALDLFPDVYDRIRRDRPGMLARTGGWWERNRLADPEQDRDGASPLFHALLEIDGRAEGYAAYRVKSNWDASVPAGEVRVREALATSPRATRALWQFLFNIDLATRVRTHISDAAAPLALMVTDVRRLRLTFGDGLWLRFVDVEAALRARSFAGDDAVVIDVRDELCPRNAGRWRVGEVTERTDDAAELALDVADLAGAYLGGFSFARLAAAARVEERAAGAIDRADALFRTPLPPFCPEVF